MEIIDNNSIERLVEKITPEVEKLTLWKVNLGTLKVMVVSPEGMWTYGNKLIYDDLCIETEPKNDGERIEHDLMRECASQVLGKYVPITETLLVAPENIRKMIADHNERRGKQICENALDHLLMSVVSHELAHRCQFVNNPEFNHGFLSIIKSIYGNSIFKRTIITQKGMHFAAYNSLIEGDALFVEETLINPVCQHAREICGVTENDCNKEIIKGIYLTKGRKKVNDLYSLNKKELVGIFLQRE